MNAPYRLAAMLAAAIMAAPPAFSQGPLVPLGGPAPTMKSLDQVEPRTPIDATRTLGNADFEFIISQPGSYYLPANVLATKPGGIRIVAPEVTVDLNGFELRRTAGGVSDGIQIASTASRSVIKNGAIRGFGRGISAPTEADQSRAIAVSVLQVRVSQTFAGIIGKNGWFIDRCVVEDSGGVGIGSGEGSRVLNCSVTRASGQGFVINSGAIAEGCTASEGETGFTVEGATARNCSAARNSGFGFFTGNGDGVVFENCRAQANGNTGIAVTVGGRVVVRDCKVDGNGQGTSGSGIAIGGSGSLVTGNVANNNRLDGISVVGDSFVTNNHVSSNGLAGVAATNAGIRASGTRNRIEGNTSVGNPTGYKVTGTGNLVVKNSNSGGTTAFDIVDGNSVGERINVFNGGAGATITNAVGAWANFAY